MTVGCLACSRPHFLCSTLPSVHQQSGKVDIQALSPTRYGLAVGYGAIALVAAIQLIRIQMRVPEYGWTTQKVFHLLNFLVATLRLGVFACWKRVSACFAFPSPRRLLWPQCADVWQCPQSPITSFQHQILDW